MTSHEQPFSKINNFNFSFALANKAKGNIQSEHDSLEERISNIVESEKFYINGFPVLKNILMLQPKKSDLKKLAKAMDRLADLVEAYEEIQSKLSIIQAVEKDPNWFAWTFGDFTQEIDQDLENFFNSQE
jgi:hypothetical protein